MAVGFFQRRNPRRLRPQASHNTAPRWPSKGAPASPCLPEFLALGRSAGLLAVPRSGRFRPGRRRKLFGPPECVSLVGPPLADPSPVPPSGPRLVGTLVPGNSTGRLDLSNSGHFGIPRVQPRDDPQPADGRSTSPPFFSSPKPAGLSGTGALPRLRGEWLLADG